MNKYRLSDEQINEICLQDMADLIRDSDWNFSEYTGTISDYAIDLINSALPDTGDAIDDDGLDMLAESELDRVTGIIREREQQFIKAYQVELKKLRLKMLKELNEPPMTDETEQVETKELKDHVRGTPAIYCALPPESKPVRIADQDYLPLEALEQIGLAKVQSLRQWIKAGSLKAVKVGKRYLVSERELKRLLEKGFK